MSADIPESNQSPQHETIGFQDGLRLQLLAERRDRVLAQKLDFAARSTTEGVVPDMTTILELSESYTGVDCGYQPSAFSRVERKMLDEAAHKANIPVHAGDSLAVGTTEPVIVWQDFENGRQTIRYRDGSGTFRNALAEVVDEVARPFKRIGKRVQLDQAVLSEEAYDLSDEKVDTVMLFMLSNPKTKMLAKDRAVFTESLYRLPVHLPEDRNDPRVSAAGVYFDEDGNLVKILQEVGRTTGVYHGMYFEPGTHVDPTETSFKLGVEIGVDRALLEPDSTNSFLVDPFLEQLTGKALTRSIESLQLTPSSRLVNILEAQDGSYGYDDLYGNSYSELTREVAKFINDPSRPVSELFQDEDAASKLKTMDLATIEDLATRVFFELLQKALKREEGQNFESEVPVFEGKIHMRQSACRDAEYYFCADVDEGGYDVVDVQGKPMLHKYSGGKTAINLEPLIYKGVEIPAGGLFQRHRDEEGKTSYAFVRMTTYALDEQSAASAYTWQHEKIKQVKPNGDISLQKLEMLGKKQPATAANQTE